MGLFEKYRKGKLPDKAFTDTEDAELDEWDGDDGDDSVHDSVHAVDPVLVEKHKREMAEWDR
jgi:hypothetical protein